MGLICAALNVRTTAEARAAVLRAREEGADLVELRLDLMREFDLARLLDGRPLPVIVTCRRQDQGGGRAWDESERLATLSRALELGAEYVDIELGSEGALRRSGSGRVIVSFHDFAGVPADLDGLARRIASAGADVVKIAMTPSHPLDCLPLYRLIGGLGRPAIVIGMGEFGAASRLLSLRFGALLSYASLAGADGTAPGQLTVAEMRDCRAGAIGASTRMFGVLGDPLAHSLSPLVHSAAYRAMGLDALYVPLRVPDRPGLVLREYAAIGFGGFSVTLPHKEAALAAADQADEVSRAIGAANTITVVRKPGTRKSKPETRNAEPRLVASNTDAEAAVAQLAGAFGGREALSGRRVLLLGAGGAARAVGWGLVRAGARLTVVNRTRERGERLAAELGAAFRPAAELAGLEFDAAVNATPQGMHPRVEGTPLPAELIRPGAVIFDTVYNPVETRLLREARERGARPVDGVGMFVEQAARQIEAWTGLRPPAEVMREAAMKRLTRTPRTA